MSRILSVKFGLGENKVALNQHHAASLPGRILRSDVQVGSEHCHRESAVCKIMCNTRRTGRKNRLWAWSAESKVNNVTATRKLHTQEVTGSSPVAPTIIGLYALALRTQWGRSRFLTESKNT